MHLMHKILGPIVSTHTPIKAMFYADNSINRIQLCSPGASFSKRLRKISYLSESLQCFKIKRTRNKVTVDIQSKKDCIKVA